ncbi:hypothetical protein OHA45_21730 [Streptomyces lydicus]|uniref:hypothetical protein n=1 Tax=Streptomyces lydicus TaxID=47763 RepID=UPI002E3435E0|nr:hypothetical protein [Streptomyces lydicus]
MSGSRVQHCFACCPPPPMGPAQVEKLAKLFASLPSKDERKKALDAWKLTLTCDDVVTRTQHRDHSYYGSSVVECPECSAWRGVMHSERVGPACSDEGAKAGRAAVDRERLAEN